jgi:hypothetical protein
MAGPVFDRDYSARRPQSATAFHQAGTWPSSLRSAVGWDFGLAARPDSATS